ncbi:MAG: TIGR02253 family HAD-type hydrolase [archaeon]
MIKAIIFDLDNTLIDFWRFKTVSVNAAIKAMVKKGLNANEKEASKIIRELYEQRGMEYKYIFQELMMRVNKKVDYRILAHGLIAYRKTRGNFLVSYKGVRKTLEKLRKKYKLAILSDAPRIKAWLRLVSMRIEDFFEVVVTFDDTMKMKPDASPFMKVLKELKVEPQEAVMIGDNIKRDIMGGRAVGMKTIFAKYGNAKRKIKSNADFEIEKIEELIKIMPLLEK